MGSEGFRSGARGIGLGQVGGGAGFECGPGRLAQQAALAWIKWGVFWVLARQSGIASRIYPVARAAQGLAGNQR